MKRRVFLKHLKDSGILYLRGGGNHAIYYDPITNRQAPVPRHGDEIGNGLARLICKQLDIDKPKSK